MHSSLPALVASLLAGISWQPVLAQESAPQEAAARKAHSHSAAAQAAFERAKECVDQKDTAGARAALVEAIEADQEHLPAHDLMLKITSDAARQARDSAAALNSELEKQYEAWSAKYPGSGGIAYGHGALLYSHEDPRAKPFLLLAVAKDPSLAKVYQMLSIDAERWGDEASAREFMRMATQADPKSPDYAFYYANSFLHVDRARWESASLAVAERFPDSVRGAQALYWLGERNEDDAKKIKFWEQARTRFPPEKFSWTSSAMPGLFDAYLRTDPAKAIELAKAMPEERSRRGGGSGNPWAAKAKLAADYARATRLLAEQKFAEAATALDALELDRRSSNAERVALLKAAAKVGIGQPETAYAMLVERLAATPEDATRTALLEIGKKLAKTTGQVMDDVWKKRDATTKPAPAFALGLYTRDAKARLSDYAGKVVLLTFWFPGCGPCRGEFPHFENVLRKFTGKDVAYLGINVDRKQDDYVVPFMKGTRYSFTPLKGDGLVEKPDAYNARGCPTNFLIDQNGRIVYRGFMIHGDNEILLQRMIESLLERPGASK